jgi:hypothetical protein
MTRCAGRKRDGGPCAVTVNAGQRYCWWHNPNLAAERRRIAATGGRAKALGGVPASIRHEVARVIEGVENGTIGRDIGVVLFQGYNVMLRACEQERKARETDELAGRIEQLEEGERVGGATRRGPWG